MFAFSSEGFVLSVTDSELRLMSSDTTSEVVVRFAPEMQFGYNDNRVVEGEEKKFESCLTVFVPPIPDEDMPDNISFAVYRISN